VRKNRKLKKSIFNIKKLSAWAKQVKTSNSYCCSACGYKGYLHSHHILPKGQHYKYAYCVWNGVSLCKRCHLGKNGVHGKGTPRNEVVKELRILMFAKDISEVKKFSSSKTRSSTKGAVPFKKFKTYKKYFKRKLY